MNKYCLICLISISLIIYTNSEDCSTLDTDAKCNAQSGCQWIETAKCTGHDSCTSATDSKSDCEAVTYGGVTCTFHAGGGVCRDINDINNTASSCSDGSTYNDCSKRKNCTWVLSEGKHNECRGETTCTNIQDPTTPDSCTAASVAPTPCTYTATGCSGEAEDTSGNDGNGGNGGNGSGNSSFGLKSSVLISLAFLFL